MTRLENALLLEGVFFGLCWALLHALRQCSCCAQRFNESDQAPYPLVGTAAHARLPFWSGTTACRMPCGTLVAAICRASRREISALS
ncbi:MAG: hypothetical protein ACN6OR_06170 [Stenotrophomonas sp.]